MDWECDRNGLSKTTMYEGIKNQAWRPMLYTNDKCNVISDKMLAYNNKIYKCTYSVLNPPNRLWSFRRNNSALSSPTPKYLIFENFPEPKGLRGVSEMGGYHPIVGPHPIPIVPRLLCTMCEGLPRLEDLRQNAEAIYQVQMKSLRGVFIEFVKRVAASVCKCFFNPIRSLISK